jgi:hypothetical protein
MDTRILANWSKRFFDLPVCKDLPRLIKGVTVYDPDGKLVSILLLHIVMKIYMI